MKHQIDPRIDCVFKAILGTEENRNLLIHFLNALLEKDLRAPIIEVEILNPYNEKEFIGDKLSIVDIKATDSRGRIFQIEIQMRYYENLLARIVYNWCNLYSQQLKEGMDYLTLKPTYSIWLLAETLLKDKDDRDYRHQIRLRYEDGEIEFEHGGIYLLELPKFKVKDIETEEQRWLKFFKDGKKLDDAKLPEWMNTNEMRQAMNMLASFSEKERNYDLYERRQEYLREQRTIQLEMQAARAALRVAMQEKDAAVQEKDAAMQRENEAMQRENAAMQREKSAWEEVERLKRQLAEQRSN